MNFNESSSKKEDGTTARHIRASSDPVSRGGAFSNGSQGLDQEPNPFEQSFSGPSNTDEESSRATSVGGVANGSSATNAQAGPSSGVPFRRARSNSPSSAMSRQTPGGTSKLPPLALIASPGIGTELQEFGWGGVDSLRSGPLSPALLNGPTHSGSLSSNPLYDTSSRLRSGLTPLGGVTVGTVSFPPPSPATAALFAMMTNNTPGTSDAGMGGGGTRPHEGLNEGNHFDASFGRAAIESKLGGGNNPRRNSREELLHQQQLLLQQQASAEQLQQLQYTGHIQGPPAPLGALHRSNLVNSIPPRGGPNQQQQPSQQQYGTMQPLVRSSAPGYVPLSLLQQQQQQQQAQQHSHILQLQQQQQQQSGNASGPGGGGGVGGNYGNQNPLYLLSQAQDLHNDDAVVAAAALSNLSGPTGYPMDGIENGGGGGGGGGVGGPGMNGTSNNNNNNNTTRQTSPSNGVAVGKGKRGAAALASTVNKRKKDEKAAAAAASAAASSSSGKKGGKKSKAQLEREEDMDDFDDGMGEEGSLSPLPHNPNETEEEKRKNFLERNRQAALKCRQRKKAWLANLQSKVEFLTADNDTLQSTVTNLKDEIASLRSILQAHASCPIAATTVDRRHQQQHQQQHQLQYAASNAQRF